MAAADDAVNDKIEELAEGMYYLAQAVEALAQQQHNEQAISMARRGKQAAHRHM